MTALRPTRFPKRVFSDWIGDDSGADLQISFAVGRRLIVRCAWVEVIRQICGESAASS